MRKKLRAEVSAQPLRLWPGLSRCTMGGHQVHEDTVPQLQDTERGPLSRGLSCREHLGAAELPGGLLQASPGAKPLPVLGVSSWPGVHRGGRLLEGWHSAPHSQGGLAKFSGRAGPGCLRGRNQPSQKGLLRPETTGSSWSRAGGKAVGQLPRCSAQPALDEIGGQLSGPGAHTSESAGGLPQRSHKEGDSRGARPTWAP